MEKTRFEIRKVKNENGISKKVVYINGNPLDWELDISLIKTDNVDTLLNSQKNLEKDFTNKVSQYLGYEVTYQEIKKAMKTGWI